MCLNDCIGIPEDLNISRSNFQNFGEGFIVNIKVTVGLSFNHI